MREDRYANTHGTKETVIGTIRKIYFSVREIEKRESWFLVNSVTDSSFRGVVASVMWTHLLKFILKRTAVECLFALTIFHSFIIEYLLCARS